MGLDNSGYLVFDVDIEMEPKTYNTSNSNLWTKVRRVFKDELAQMYRDMRASTFKEENLFNILIGEQIDKIPESLYNEDSERKYIKNPKYLHMLHGNRREHMKKWITERLLYLDSQFGYEKNTSESIIIRANKKGRVELNIKTYSPMFVKVRWRNDSTSTEIKKVGRNETVTFVGDLPTETDQEIAIYGAKHIKEIGDISHMTPSSLTLGNAVRLTKIECRNSPNLKAIGLGGSASEDGSRLKNLQLIDLTGCSKLGQDTSSADLNVSYCDNLKTLKLHETNLQSVTFNIEGGNLEEMYLPNSLTSLHLNNQYSLRKVEFPKFAWANRLLQLYVYKHGSKITNLTINNCPNIVDFGLADHIVDLNEILNYRQEPISNQNLDFDISKDEYKKTLRLSCFGRLESVQINNSLLDYSYYTICMSPSLSNITFNNMPNLKGLISLGNRTYVSGWQRDAVEGEPMFDSININNCPNFDTIIIQQGCNYHEYAFKFKKDFIWDLSNLPLKRFICNISLENLKKIILPDTIKEFSHSRTVLVDRSAGQDDGARRYYTADMSPLETIVVKGHYEEGFKGIDLADIPLQNMDINGLVQKVDRIQNIDCKAIDVPPRITMGKMLENIKINFNEYKGASMRELFKGIDMSEVTITSENKLTTKNMDYTSMFYEATNVHWDKIQKFIKNLPPGNINGAFKGCDVDKLEVGHMMGSNTVRLFGSFQNMPNVREISLQGANTNGLIEMYSVFPNCPNLARINLAGFDTTKVENFRSCFSNNPNLEEIVGVENLIQEKCNNVEDMFNHTPKLKFNFPKGKPNWNFTQNNIYCTKFMYNCGKDVQLRENEEYILDLSDCGAIITKSGLGSSFYAVGFTKVILKAQVIDGSSQDMFCKCPNLKTLSFVNDTILTGHMPGIVQICSNLTSVDMSGVNMEGITNLGYPFHVCTNLTDVKFGHGLRVGTSFQTNTNLTKPSLMSILENIGTANSGATLTLSQDSWDLLSDEDRNIAARKGWTIAKG